MILQHTAETVHVANWFINAEHWLMRNRKVDLLDLWEMSCDEGLDDAGDMGGREDVERRRDYTLRHLSAHLESIFDEVVLAAVSDSDFADLDDPRLEGRCPTDCHDTPRAWLVLSLIAAMKPRVCFYDVARLIAAHLETADET